jgi:hypothetical protein
MAPLFLAFLPMLHQDDLLQFIPKDFGGSSQAQVMRQSNSHQLSLDSSRRKGYQTSGELKLSDKKPVVRKLGDLTGGCPSLESNASVGIGCVVAGMIPTDGGQGRGNFSATNSVRLRDLLTLAASPGRQWRTHQRR